MLVRDMCHGRHVCRITTKLVAPRSDRLSFLSHIPHHYRPTTMPDEERTAKRTRVDDEAASRGDPSNLDNLKRDADLWMEDGNIVLVERDVAFRIYRGLLTKQSTVFGDMFATGDPAADEHLDGCPVVRLPDAPSDLKHLLQFLVPSTGRT